LTDRTTREASPHALLLPERAKISHPTKNAQAYQEGPNNNNSKKKNKKIISLHTPVEWMSTVSQGCIWRKFEWACFLKESEKQPQQADDDEEQEATCHKSSSQQASTR
jgi:hypothetical protein